VIHLIVILSGNSRDRDILDGFIAEEAAYLPGLGLLGGGLLPAAFDSLLAGKDGREEEDEAAILPSDLVDLVR
jgi:hypothetical protein